jgi:hypothetical protein
MLGSPSAGLLLHNKPCAVVEPLSAYPFCTCFSLTEEIEVFACVGMGTLQQCCDLMANVTSLILQVV